MSKLQNIKAIRQMLDGNHWTQTRKKFSVSDSESSADRNQLRQVGDVWEEKNERGEVVAIWEQKKGYRVRRAPNADALDQIKVELEQFPNCLPDCRVPNHLKTSRLDKRFRAKFGRCADCQFRFETRLKQQGKYKQYEQELMLANAESFFKNADTEIEVVAKHLAGDIQYANSDGSMDTWGAEGDIGSKLKEEYNQFKQIVLDRLKNKQEQTNETGSGE